MIVTVLLFGHYRDLVPTDANGAITLSLAEPANTQDVAALLAAREPRFADLLARTRVAVGAEFATAQTVVNHGDEIAFLPPMSGG